MPGLPTTCRPLVIVDDDENDIFFLERLLKKAAPGRPLLVWTDTPQALAYLQRVTTGAADLPLVVFLDIKMPMHSGFELLRWIRAQPQLEPVSVCMLSSSREGTDVRQAHVGGAECYLEKHPTAGILEQVVAAAEQRAGSDRAAFKGIKGSLISPPTVS